MNKNYGFSYDLEKSHISDEDYVYGAFSPICIATIPEIERPSYLPKGEVQRGKEDMMDCATRGPLNILETKFNWLNKKKMLSPANHEWLVDKYLNPETDGIEFSDAFPAIKSGTTKDGNSLKAPLQAIHDHGLIPKCLLPLEPWMTFDDYHDKGRITGEMNKIGREFKRRFPIRYDKVYRVHFGELYKEDMLDLAGYAWPAPVDGVYHRTDGTLNHVFAGISNPMHLVFDNYIDESDGDFIKRLAPDYDLLEYGYRLYVSENSSPRRTFCEMLQDLLNL